jgi:ABC-2 type transport system permease protein
VFLEATGRAQSWALPSHWASTGMLAAAKYQFAEALFWFLLLLSTALTTLLLAGWTARHIFLRGYSYLAGQDKQRIRPLDRGLLNQFERILAWAPNPLRALTIKDIKLFWRDPTQWSQFVIFFGIMAIYIANLRNTSRYYEQEMWRSWIACLNVGSVTLILATLTSRFVFPLISLEGRRFWILGLAPFTFSRLVWQKFWLSVATTSLFTIGLAFLSATMLQLEPVYFWMTVYSVTIANFGLAGLAVGLGALYPNFNEDNPARIVSGLGGTLNLLLSIGYITVVVAAQTLVLQYRAIGRIANPDWFRYALAASVLAGACATLLCIALPLYFGLRNLRDMEY